MRPRPVLALASAALALTALASPRLLRHFAPLPGVQAHGGVYRLQGSLGQMSGAPAAGGPYSLLAGAGSPVTPPARVCFPSTPGLYVLPTPAPPMTVYALYLPLQARAPAAAGVSAAGAPDLAVAFEYCPSHNGQPASLQITITNIGDAATPAGFRVDAWADLDQAPPPAVNWETACPELACRGTAWHVAAALAPGGQVTLTGAAAALAEAAWLPESARSLYVYVDTAATGAVGHGQISERNELNNRGDWVP